MRAIEASGSRSGRRSAGRRRPGFTLLEMILVISTILFLLGFLISMAGSAHVDAKKRATESIVLAIETAVITFHGLNGSYPPIPGGMNNTSYPPELYKYLVDAKYGGCMPQVPQGAINYTPRWGTPPPPAKPYFVDAWSAHATRNKGPAGDVYWIGQIFYVAFDQAALQPLASTSPLKEKQKMWGLCGGVPLIWSNGPDALGYDAVYVSGLKTAQELQDLFYKTTGSGADNADNIHNFRDIPMNLVN